MTNVIDELRALGVIFGKQGALEASERLHHASNHVRGLPAVTADALDDDIAAGELRLNTELKAIGKKGRAWWDPPHNYLISMTLMGTVNDWRFRILPMFADRTAYRPADTLRGTPEGLVIDPAWSPLSSDPIGGGSAIDPTTDVVEKLIKFARAQESVVHTVGGELKWVESKFGIEIPGAIKSKLVGDALKVATRRWGVDRLRRKKILVPFDGSKSIELSSF